MPSTRQDRRARDGADPLEQWLWHPYYVDAPAIRYYDDNVDGSGIVDQYFTHDANMNVTALANNAGAVQERYEYDPYGMTTVLDANFADDADGVSDYLNPITYCGYRADAETGLYQVRHRYLDPGLGRWVTRDPIGYDGSKWNLCENVRSSPIRSTDPTGMLMCWCWIRAIARDTQWGWDSRGVTHHDGGHKQGHNAMFHCLIACKIHVVHDGYCDSDWNGREVAGTPGGDIDLANNKVGQSATNSFWTGCWKHCLRKWRSGQLTCLDDQKKLVPCPPPPSDFPEEEY